MAERPVPKVGDDLLAAVKPVMDGLIIGWNTPELARGGNGVVVTVCHVFLPQNVWT
jgi:hypothetical protein